MTSQPMNPRDRRRRSKGEKKRCTQRFTSDLLAVIEMCAHPFFSKGGGWRTYRYWKKQWRFLNGKSNLYRPPYLAGKPKSFLLFLAKGEQIYQRKVCTPQPASSKTTHKKTPPKPTNKLNPCTCLKKILQNPWEATKNHTAGGGFGQSLQSRPKTWKTAVTLPRLILSHSHS